MTLILDPGNSEDAAGFQGIMDLAETTSTAAQINASPLFVAAENYIVAKIPAAALPGGRMHPKRSLIVVALQFLTGSYFLMGGGETAHKNAGLSFSGVVESLSEQIGQTSRTTRYAKGSNTLSRSQVSQMTLEDRSAWLKTQADSLIDSILGEEPRDVGDLVTKAKISQSRIL